MLFTTPIVSRLAAVLLLIAASASIYTFPVEPIISSSGEIDRQIEEARDVLASCTSRGFQSRRTLKERSFIIFAIIL